MRRRGIKEGDREERRGREWKEKERRWQRQKEENGKSRGREVA
jgi:hypothetical protein